MAAQLCVVKGVFCVPFLFLLCICVFVDGDNCGVENVFFIYTYVWHHSYVL